MSKPLGKPDRIVVALGGNALGNTPEEQIEKVGHAAHALLGLIEQGNEIIITHGNGPQVGMIQNAFAAAHDAIGTPSMDLPECGAMSQGYIGYHLQQGIGREMHKRYSYMECPTGKICMGMHDEICRINRYLSKKSSKITLRGKRVPFTRPYC